MRTVLIALGVLVLLGVASGPSRGDPPASPPTAEPARLQAEFRHLEQKYGPNHPKVLAVKARLAKPDEAAFQGPVLVLTRTGSTAATLRDLQVRQLGGRPFLVGEEVKSDFTRGAFAGKKVWICVDEVTQLVELGNPKPEEK